MEHEVFVPVPADHLAAALADPARVARALPGLQRDAAAEGVAGRLKLRVAGSSVTYRGSLGVTRQDDGAFTAEAEGGEARGDGTVRATVHVTLRPRPDGTVLHFAGEATATGRISGFDADAVRGALTRLLERFAADLPGQGGEDANGPEEGSATVTSDDHDEVVPGAGEPLVPEFAPAADGDFDARPDADDPSPAGTSDETSAPADGTVAARPADEGGSASAPADRPGTGADTGAAADADSGVGEEAAAHETDADSAADADAEGDALPDADVPGGTEAQAAEAADAQSRAADADAGDLGADAAAGGADAGSAAAAGAGAGARASGAAEGTEAQAAEAADDAETRPGDADAEDADAAAEAADADADADDDADADGEGEGGPEGEARGSVFDVPVPPPSLDPAADHDEDGADLFPEDPDGDAAADAAQARRTMIGRSAEEVDHAPPRGRYAPVPAPQPGMADRTLRWAAPAAAALAMAAGAIAVTRALRRQR